MVLIADIFIWLVLVLLVVACVAVVASKIVGLRRNKPLLVVNGIPAKRITWGVTAATVLLLLVTFVALPVDTMIINGIEYNDTTWLRVANMCVVTSLVLMLVAAVGVIVGRFRK